jgi:hypothetical protein
VSLEEDELERRLPDTHDWRQTMSPGEKQAGLLDKALDCKWEILTMSLPEPDDMSPESHRIRALVLDPIPPCTDADRPAPRSGLEPSRGRPAR